MAAAGVTLGAFLTAAVERRFRRGEHDCLLFVADWARHLTGIDPGAPWRGTYADAAGADAILDAAGGAAELLASALEPAGWAPVSEPARGDVAALVVPGPGATLEAAGGICVTPDQPGRAVRWAMVAERGLVIAPAPALRIWRLARG